MAKILFSPIGGSDPIRNYHDGSMLHICRNYLPDRVVLYLSGEMYQHHVQDNRYVYCLEELGKKMSHPFEIEVIVRDELTEVQDYEYFYTEFTKCINDIVAQMDEGDELLLNVSSGTPAMKNALIILATLAEFSFQPIQVSTPLKRSNYMDENTKKYEVQEQWEFDEDNEPQEGDTSRCEEIKSLNLVKLLKVNMLEKHLQAYDYTAALEIARDLKNHISVKATAMIEQANERNQLNTKRVNELAKKIDYQPMPVKNQENCDLLEYVLLLQMKVRRKEYADFIRAITPVVFELFYRVLKRQCHIDIKDYCDEKKSGLRWNLEKIKQTEVGDILQKEYAATGFRGGPVYSSQLKPLILHYSVSEKVNSLVTDLRHAEEKARNKAAHTIVSITNEKIVKWTDYTAEELLVKIQQLTLFVVPGQDGSIWDSYDRMNEAIMKETRQEILK
ncbi:MAG: type III-A CRISPR-associated CARF protein Csm6 [Eubacterium sp.]